MQAMPVSCGDEKSLRITVVNYSVRRLHRAGQATAKGSVEENEEHGPDEVPKELRGRRRGQYSVRGFRET